MKSKILALYDSGRYTIPQLAEAFELPIWRIRQMIPNPPEKLCYDTIAELQQMAEDNLKLARMYKTTQREIVNNKYITLYKPRNDRAIREALLNNRWPQKYHISDVRAVLADLVTELLATGNYTQEQIAEILPVSRSTVCKLNKNSTTRNSKYKRLTPQEWLELDIYLEQGHNISEAARKFGISRTAIYNRRKK